MRLLSPRWLGCSSYRRLQAASCWPLQFPSAGKWAAAMLQLALCGVLTCVPYFCADIAYRLSSQLRRQGRGSGLGDCRPARQPSG